MEVLSEAGTLAPPVDDVADDGGTQVEQQQPRDYEADARKHGWSPKDEFKGDPAKWVDAETFVKRADEVMPFLQKQNSVLKREIDDLKLQIKKSAQFFSQAEERAYKRAISELEARHDEAVETGDVAASKRIRTEMQQLAKDHADGAAIAEPKAREGDPAKEFAEWVEANDWYVTDDARRTYADIQAQAMGAADEYEGGPKAWLDELTRRVNRKFAEAKPNPVNGGGNRSQPGARGAKTFNDLPAQAKQLCDKWVKQGIIKSRDDYVKNYQWD
jgi:hypothetical protein